MDKTNNYKDGDLLISDYPHSGKFIYVDLEKHKNIYDKIEKTLQSKIENLTEGKWRPAYTSHRKQILHKRLKRLQNDKLYALYDLDSKYYRVITLTELKSNYSHYYKKDHNE